MSAAWANGFTRITANAHLVTFWVSGLPAAALVALLFVHFRREGSGVRDALTLAAGFGLGSLILPYSGVMMNHTMLALCLFGGWLALSRQNVSNRAVLAGGGLLGIAFLVDYLAGPLIPFYLVVLIATSRSVRKAGLFLIGPAVSLAVTFAINSLTYSQLLVTSYGLQSRQFVTEGLLLGVFHWPQLIRLYWLSVHPFRGLFYCCPVLLIGVVGFLRAVIGRSLHRTGLLPVFVVAYFVLFNLSFNAWTGGWGIGPRYLVPAIPFLYAYAHHGFIRHKWLSGAVMVLSAIIMIAVTAVAAMIPANNFGPPPDLNPVRVTMQILLAGKVSVSTQGILERHPGPSAPGQLEDRWDSYNLGEAAGLQGVASLLPVLLVVAAFYLIVFRSTRPPSPGRAGGS
jgi:hypothetical protein